MSGGSGYACLSVPTIPGERISQVCRFFPQLSCGCSRLKLHHWNDGLSCDSQGGLELQGRHLWEVERNSLAEGGVLSSTGPGSRGTVWLLQGSFSEPEGQREGKTPHWRPRAWWLWRLELAGLCFG